MSKENSTSYWYGIIGVIVGAFLSFFSGIGLWYIQSNYKYRNSIKDRREELIMEVAEIFARAPRIKGLIYGHALQVSAATTLSSLCLSLSMQGKIAKGCDKKIDYEIMNKFNDEIFEYQARYMKLRNLVEIYFCKETIEKFKKMESQKAWWEITPKEASSILKSMHKEYDCNL